MLEVPRDCGFYFQNEHVLDKKIRSWTFSWSHYSIFPSIYGNNPGQETFCLFYIILCKEYKNLQPVNLFCCKIYCRLLVRVHSGYSLTYLLRNIFVKICVAFDSPFWTAIIFFVFYNKMLIRRRWTRQKIIRCW